MISALNLSNAFTGLTRAVAEFPDINWLDATSHGQMESKAWLCDLLDDLAPHYGTTWVIGGWVGLLPLLLLSTKSDRFDRIITIDLDVRACRAADTLLKRFVMSDLQFAACPGDAMNIDYRMERIERIKSDGSFQALQISCKTIINTSWEHFSDPEAWFKLRAMTESGVWAV